MLQHVHSLRAAMWQEQRQQTSKIRGSEEPMENSALRKEVSVRAKLNLLCHVSAGMG